MTTSYLPSSERFGFDFIPNEFLPPGKDEYYLRNVQTEIRAWRRLERHEIDILEANGNRCPDWDNVLVTDPFNPRAVRGSSFYGLVRLGPIGEGVLKYHDYTVPEGITGSTLISCDVGAHCAVHDCTYVSHYVIGDRVILSSVREMETTNHAKFGEGIVKEGEPEDVRVWISPLNEAGGRDILAFEGMTCADAYLWTIYRDDAALMDAFKRITQDTRDSRRGYYGTIGNGSVIKHCHIIKDVRAGEGVYIKGANKLKNLTIQSAADSPSQIGEGVELVNGVIGYGCRVFYGCKAVRFVMGNNCALKYGARLIHSVLGDNSTISCCEVLNNLVFPAHEQHHNNSFLIASLIMGQSNMAAGATVGSNHNSRGNDGELIAGRGFWPALSCTLKHNSRFASYTLITKGNYQHELCVTLPFSMIMDNASADRLEIMPAYWWMHNMYALERNSVKYRDRDTRVYKTQFIETDYLAPDTAAEIIEARRLLECWTGKGFLETGSDESGYIDVAGESIERSNRPVRILRPVQAYRAYTSMLVYYGVKTVMEYCENTGENVRTFLEGNTAVYRSGWVNLGGQLVPGEKADALRADIALGYLQSWDAIHERYALLLGEYPLDKARDALGVLGIVTAKATLGDDDWNALLDEAVIIRHYVDAEILRTKLKDYRNPFRDVTYRNEAERDAVLGRPEDNPFILNARLATERFGVLAQKHRIHT